MIVTAFVDVLSHWCYAAVPALAALRDTLSEDVRLELVFAPFGDGAPLGWSNEAESWFYRRGTHSYGAALSAAWCEDERTSTWHANAAVAAGIAAGAEPVGLMRAASRAALRDGRLLGREEEAAHVVAEASGVALAELLRTMRSETVGAALHAGNARLRDAGCNERPSWELRNEIGDRAVLQGVWQAEAILPVARALLDDERAYARAGRPPAFS